MKIERIENGDEITLKLGGCLDTAAAAEFGAALEGAAEAKTLTVDFADLEFIASSGIRLLVAANKRAVVAGKSIVLANMNEVVADVFDVTGLMDVFTVK